MLSLTSAVTISILALVSCGRTSDLLKGTSFDISSRSRTNLPTRTSPTCQIKFPKAIIHCENIYDLINDGRHCSTNQINTSFFPMCIKNSKCKAPLRFVEKTLYYIKKQMTAEKFRRNQRKIKNILEWINKHMSGDKNEFALFTASALHNTSFFTVFESSEKTTFRSRGLLAIRDQSNYEILNDIKIKRSYDYVDSPCSLAKVEKVNIINTIRFWKKLMPKKCKLTFKVMMDKLKTVSWVKYACGQSCKAEDIINREEIYTDLLEIYAK